MTIPDLRAEVQEVQDQLCFVQSLLACAASDCNTDVWGYLEASVYTTTLIQEFLNQPWISSWYLNVLNGTLMDVVLQNDQCIDVVKNIIGAQRLFGQNMALVHFIGMLLPIIVKFKELDDYESDRQLNAASSNLVKMPRSITRKQGK